jgi:hypothetical protein
MNCKEKNEDKVAIENYFKRRCKEILEGFYSK